MNEIISYLEKRGIQFKRRGEECIMNCPFCGDTEKKFSINVLSGLYNCLHLNKCGVKGDFSSLQRHFGDIPKKLKQRFLNENKTNYKKPNKEVLPIKPGQKNVFEYLKGRGFTIETIKHFRLGADENIVKFPYFKNGELTNIKYRNILDKKKTWQEKDAEPLLFNRDNIEGKRIVICEGEFDCLALFQYGIEAVSVPGGASNMDWVEREWEYLETFDKIYLCYDNDNAGKHGAMEAAERIGLWRCFIVELPRKDANECLMQGIPKQEISNSFNNSKDLTPDTIVDPLYFQSKIHDLFQMGTKLFGTPTAWKALDSILKGWRGGEVTIWSGRNGSGKSTIINQVILDLAEKGEKSCIYSGEMPPDRYLRWAIIQQSKIESPAPYKIDETLHWMSGKLYIVNLTDMITPDKLLNDFEYAARRYGCKHFVIDSLMKIQINENDEYNQQKQFVGRLAEFCQKFNCHIHLVAHPRKSNTDDDTPGKVDIKGSSHITDLAHNVIVLYRPSDEHKEKSAKKKATVSDMQLYVKKNREFGVEGKIHMFFNAKTKTFRGIDETYL